MDVTERTRIKAIFKAFLTENDAYLQEKLLEAAGVPEKNGRLRRLLWSAREDVRYEHQRVFRKTPEGFFQLADAKGIGRQASGQINASLRKGIRGIEKLKLAMELSTGKEFERLERIHAKQEYLAALSRIQAKKK
jgi:hypothetical protein